MRQTKNIGITGVFCALLTMGAAGVARADMLAINWLPTGELGSLRTADGQWEFERDWFQARVADGSLVTVGFETWIEAAPVAFDMYAYSDGNNKSVNGLIHVTKSIENATDDVWDGFQIDVLPLYPIDWVEVVPESVTFTVFDTAEVVNSGDGTAGITLAVSEGGEGMMPGGIASVSFDVRVPNALFTPFQINQYPVPEPASAALATIALLAARLRRRVP